MVAAAAEPPAQRARASASAGGCASGRDLVEHVSGSSEAAPRKVRVVTSSLARAMATGDAIAAALGVDPIRDHWDERSFGEWDGLTFEQIAARRPAKYAAVDPSYPPPGGKSRADVAARVHRAWSAVAPGPGVTIVVTSRVPILVVLNHLLGIAPERFWAFAVGPRPRSRSSTCGPTAISRPRRQPRRPPSPRSSVA